MVETFFFFLCPRTVCSRWWVVIKLNASRGKVGRTRAHEPYCWFGWYYCSCRMIFPVCWCGRNFELEFLQQVAGFIHVSKYGFKVTTLYEYEKNPKITVSVKHSDKKKSIPKLLQISKPWRNQSIAWQLLPVHQTIFFQSIFISPDDGARKRHWSNQAFQRKISTQRTVKQKKLFLFDGFKQHKQQQQSEGLKCQTKTFWPVPARIM